MLGKFVQRLQRLALRRKADSSDMASRLQEQEPAREQERAQERAQELPPPAVHTQPFALLAPELRENIYKFCVHDVAPAQHLITPNYCGTTQVLVRNAPWLPLLSAARHIHHEAKYCIDPQLQLTLVDHYRSEIALYPPPIIPELQGVTKVEALMLAVCPECCGSSSNGLQIHHCAIRSEIQAHTRWLTKTSTDLYKLKELTLKLYMWWPKEEEEEEQWPSSPHTGVIAQHLLELVQVNGVTSLEVHRVHKSSEPGDNAKTISENVSDLYVSWTPTAGWVEGAKKEKPAEQSDTKAEKPIGVDA